MCPDFLNLITRSNQTIKEKILEVNPRGLFRWIPNISFTCTMTILNFSTRNTRGQLFVVHKPLSEHKTWVHRGKCIQKNIILKRNPAIDYITDYRVPINCAGIRYLCYLLDNKVVYISIIKLKYVKRTSVLLLLYILIDCPG